MIPNRPNVDLGILVDDEIRVNRSCKLWSIRSGNWVYGVDWNWNDMDSPWMVDRNLD